MWPISSFSRGARYFPLLTSQFHNEGQYQKPTEKAHTGKKGAYRSPSQSHTPEAALPTKKDIRIRLVLERREKERKKNAAEKADPPQLLRLSMHEHAFGDWVMATRERQLAHEEYVGVLYLAGETGGEGEDYYVVFLRIIMGLLIRIRGIRVRFLGGGDGIAQ
ncbi:hypothetical protein L207DRAFT_140618 [Hyaloscypha variabilis F]|uniref:Uncharacterized protein n=1 Tax=Hyaloscypha variabilis (strain UAMH 11265 / GT02V1 / F) TaxID=1149755 RepID=A0A2J6R7C6_HYAVF|nr:hypothetical protein L207DRAFT_140618 [Hyaloscypha variabilis F]